MRPIVRKARMAYAGAGALMLAIPAAAVALSAAPFSSPSSIANAASSSTLRVSIRRRRISYGQDVSVTGTAPTSTAGQTLWLEFAGLGDTSWRALTSTKVLPGGGFLLRAPLRHSGLVRVLGGASAADVRPANAPLGASGESGGAFVPSSSQRVAVAAWLRVPARSLDALSGQALGVRGKLLPAAAGRRVRLEGRGAGGWRTLTVTRTGRRGGFDLRFVAAALGRQPLRVRFAGDRQNDPVLESAGLLTVYTQSVASWYEDAGSTACGFHVHYGVANKTLPCGTRIAFRYGGRSVTAVVDDRGPYVSGREWDFNQNLAGALGFDGVGTVWSTR